MLTRLILPGIGLSGAIAFSDRDGRHIFSALRMREGDRLILADGTGREALCVLTAGRGADVLEILPPRGKPDVSVHLYPSLSKGERFEWMLQKAAELNAASVTPVLSRRCVAGVPSEDKLERYRRILRGASEQSGRANIPELNSTVTFQDCLTIAPGLRLFCYEEERAVSLKSVLRGGAAEISVLTGPEGGYAPEEAGLAARNGWKPVSLGENILRCETAPLLVLAAVMYQNMLIDSGGDHAEK